MLIDIDLSSLTKQALMEYAAKKGISVKAYMTKAVMIEKITASNAASQMEKKEPKKATTSDVEKKPRKKKELNEPKEPKKSATSDVEKKPRKKKEPKEPKKAATSDVEKKPRKKKEPKEPKIATTSDVEKKPRKKKEVIEQIAKVSPPKLAVSDAAKGRAKLWVRAPWRDLENKALKARGPKWMELYVQSCPYFEDIFTIKGVKYALDVYSNRKIKSARPADFVKSEWNVRDFLSNLDRVDISQLENRIAAIHNGLNNGLFNRVDMAILIANCLIAYYSYGFDIRIQNLIFALIHTYYDKNTPQIPYRKTLGWKVKWVYEDSSFLGQLAGNWKSSLPNNVQKFPYNDLLPIPKDDA